MAEDKAKGKGGRDSGRDGWHGRRGGEERRGRRKEEEERWGGRRGKERMREDTTEGERREAKGGEGREDARREDHDKSLVTVVPI